MLDSMLSQLRLTTPAQEALRQHSAFASWVGWWIVGSLMLWVLWKAIEEWFKPPPLV